MPIGMYAIAVPSVLFCVEYCLFVLEYSLCRVEYRIFFVELFCVEYAYWNNAELSEY